MNLKQRIEQRRNRFQNNLERLQQNRNKNLEKQRQIAGSLPDIDLEVNRSLNFNMCPVHQRLIEMEFKENEDKPFGLPAGTIRACLTIWITLTTCIIMMGILLNPRMPVVVHLELLKWWLFISGIVIGSYFLTRYKKIGGIF